MVHDKTENIQILKVMFRWNDTVIGAQGGEIVSDEILATLMICNKYMEFTILFYLCLFEVVSTIKVFNSMFRMFSDYNVYNRTCKKIPTAVHKMVSAI